MKKTEVEVKLKLADLADIGARLKGVGAHLVHPREFEDNQLYDFPDFSLKTRGAMLRVRIQERASVLTYKEAPRVEGGVKLRDEMEVSVSSGETLSTIIGRLGMRPLFRYQKYRAVYEYSDLLITVDETPIGLFMELEGPKPLIDEMATKLGYKASDYIAKSYLALYQDYLKTRGLPLKDMLFETP
ncbi:MAG TPA: class IV adenylate cyclase [Candidatus Polarisedimenticolia bacterium]|nr:class IV adenylate cyclase [Candidatus Polarisedimenticolia bacterium]